MKGLFEELERLKEKAQEASQKVTQHYQVIHNYIKETHGTVWILKVTYSDGRVAVTRPGVFLTRDEAVAEFQALDAWMPGYMSDPLYVEEDPLNLPLAFLLRHLYQMELIIK